MSTRPQGARLVYDASLTAEQSGTAFVFTSQIHDFGHANALQTVAYRSYAVLSEPDSKVHSYIRYLAMRLVSILIEAICAHAVALSIDFSQSLARRRQRPSQAKVLSTTHLLGRTTKPLA